MTLSVYRWEDVHRYFPQEVIEQYRKKIIEEWKSGKFKDREIWERYGMSENAFYDLIKRHSEEENLKDKPSKPKNPSHKRRIANWFNVYFQNLGKNISIGKSRVHGILASAGIFEREKKIEKKPKHLSRPKKPLASFSMDFTQKRIGNGDTGYVFGLLDMHNDAFVTLTGHPEKNGDIVVKNLEIVEKNFIPKGSPWLQAFIERGFRTIKEEFLNLVWIGNWNKFNDVLRDARYGYNHRPNSAFDYRNPLEVMATKISNLPQQVTGH